MSQTQKEELWNAVKSEEPIELDKERWEHIKQLLKQGYEEQQIAKELLLSLEAFGALSDFIDLKGEHIELEEGLDVQDVLSLGRTLCQIAHEAPQEHPLKQLSELGAFEVLRLRSIGAVPAEELEDEERVLFEDIVMRTSLIPAGSFMMGESEVELSNGFLMMKLILNRKSINLYQNIEIKY